MKKASIFLFLAIQFIFSSSSFGQSPSVTNGLNYLFLSQNPDGSWDSDVSNSDVLPATVSVIETLKILNQAGTSNYSNALSWLQAQGLDTTDYLSERIHALSVSGADTDLLLSYIDQLALAWGGYDDCTVNNFDTVMALLALRQINYQDQSTINSAVNYLLGTQKSDGGWGFDKDSDSEVYYTALISSALQQFTQTTSIATAINKATTYLVAHQNIDGGFGVGGASPAPTTTTYETALAYMALVGVITDNTVLGGAVNYLTSTQLTDGSWDQDPYSTALALRALYISENLPAPPPPPPPAPTTGTITGKVADASTNLVLSGVSVTAISIQPSVTTTTDATGSFSLADIPQGSQQITFSLSGYSSASAIVNVTAGSIIDIGVVYFSLNPTTGMIKGTVTDSANGQPLSSVTITVSGSFTGSTTTGSDGTFMIANVTPGTVSLSATKSGYYSGYGNRMVIAPEGGL